MDEQEFRLHVGQLGYTESELIELEPEGDGELHTHEVSSVGFVVRGSVRLEFDPDEITNGPGEFCEVGSGVLHCERAGPEGATVLLLRQEDPRWDPRVCIARVRTRCGTLTSSMLACCSAVLALAPTDAAILTPIGEWLFRSDRSSAGRRC